MSLSYLIHVLQWTCVHDIQFPSAKQAEEPWPSCSKAEDEAGVSGTAASSMTIDSASVGLGASDLAGDSDSTRPGSPSFMLSISVDDSLNPLIARASAPTGATDVYLQNDSDSQDSSQDNADHHDDNPESRDDFNDSRDDSRDSRDDADDDDTDAEDNEGARTSGNWLLIDREQADAPAGRRLQRHTQVC